MITTVFITYRTLNRCHYGAESGRQASWDTRKELSVCCWLSFFFWFYLFIFRERGREEERERNIDVWLPLIWPPLGTWPATQACAPTGIRTANLQFAARTQSTELHQPGLLLVVLKYLEGSCVESDQMSTLELQEMGLLWVGVTSHLPKTGGVQGLPCGLLNLWASPKKTEYTIMNSKLGTKF